LTSTISTPASPGHRRSQFLPAVRVQPPTTSSLPLRSLPLFVPHHPSPRPPHRLLAFLPASSHPSLHRLSLGSPPSLRRSLAILLHPPPHYPLASRPLSTWSYSLYIYSCIMYYYHLLHYRVTAITAICLPPDTHPAFTRTAEATHKLYHHPLLPGHPTFCHHQLKHYSCQRHHCIPVLPFPFRRRFTPRANPSSTLPHLCWRDIRFDFCRRLCPLCCL
jgi:hypothetical protein